jgi:hypothetical protein
MENGLSACRSAARRTETRVGLKQVIASLISRLAYLSWLVKPLRAVE